MFHQPLLLYGLLASLIIANLLSPVMRSGPVVLLFFLVFTVMARLAAVIEHERG